LDKFNEALGKAKFIVGQNLGFDLNIMGSEFHRLGLESQMSKMPVLDTCTEVTASLLKLPGGRGGRFKLPTLTELHSFLLIKVLGSITRPPLRLRRVVSGIDRRENYTKEQLDVPGLFPGIPK
jgi:DNA polymerase-3 subunit alpha